MKDAESMAISNSKRSVAKMKVTIRKGILTTKLPLISPARKSKSGKTLVVASSCGPRKTAQRIEGKPIIVNVAAWIRPHKLHKSNNSKRRPSPEIG
jgi:hypothetical protein